MRILRDGAFAGGIEQTFGGQSALERLKFLMPQAESFRLPEIDDHLILPAGAVHREPACTHNGLSVFHAAGKARTGTVLPYFAGERIKGFVPLLSPEPYAVEKIIAFLQGKVDMSGGGAGKVGHLAPYPDIRKAAFHRLPHLFRDLSYAEDGAHAVFHLA